MSDELKKWDELKQWMESLIKEIWGKDCKSIAVAIDCEEGTYSAYYHCNISEKRAAAATIFTDAILDAVKANVDMIKRALEEQEENGDAGE